MTCPSCAADPQPKNFGDPRKCAFRDDGAFTRNNWSCATIDGLLDYTCFDTFGTNESIELVRRWTRVIPLDEDEQWMHRGWIVLTRYKNRGATTDAVLVGDFVHEPLTLAIAEETLRYYTEK
jgi:hypothetical protein